MFAAEVDELQCKVCNAHATGFHFEAQSCSACCAFFRRAISLKRSYKCINGHSPTANAMCRIDYTEPKLCRACRLRKCFAVGMNKSFVQGPKTSMKKMRAYCTNSGLRRNKRFSVLPNDMSTVSTSAAAAEPDNHPLLRAASEPTAVNWTDCSRDNKSTARIRSGSGTEILTKRSEEVVAENVDDYEDDAVVMVDVGEPEATHSAPPPTVLSTTNILRIFVEEEMRIAERRRILFCERPVGSLLGCMKICPFTIHDIKPLNFREFRKSIRTHILFIYEWLRVCPYYGQLCKQDQLTFLRKCVLYHTILDPCFITLQLGDLSKFVMQNGGYVSTISECSDGWQDEKEISHDNKKKLLDAAENVVFTDPFRIYWPLLHRVMTEIIAQMVNLRLEFEEFVALKALVSIQMTLCDISQDGRATLRRASDEICRSLSEYYRINDDLDKATRYGSILLLLSPIFDTATNFVESHHQVQFFDLWQLDSLLLQFLKNKV